MKVVFNNVFSLENVKNEIFEKKKQNIDRKKPWTFFPRPLIFKL